MKYQWVLKKYFLVDGSIEKFKARPTAKGIIQLFVIDYQETFQPTPDLETDRIMLVFAH